MAGRLSRFLNLERPRAADDADPRLPSAQPRFGPSPEEGAPEPPGAGLERHRLERMQNLASGVDLAETSDEEQPFRRCALCEMDNNRAASRCQNCGADLDTAEQRDFNASLWAHRREESTREKADLAALHGAHAIESRTAAAGTGAIRDSLARAAAGHRAQAPTRAASLATGDDPWTGPPGMRVLGRLPAGVLRVAAGLAVLGVAAFLGLRWLDGSRSGFGLPEVLLIALAYLFLPRGWRRSGFFDRWR
ncbi:MAG: hypothetical protein NVSMB23_05910 [Myxococcales bacterium]